jgi:hypothetical protein
VSTDQLLALTGVLLGLVPEVFEIRVGIGQVHPSANPSQAVRGPCGALPQDDLLFADLDAETIARPNIQAAARLTWQGDLVLATDLGA